MNQPTTLSPIGNSQAVRVNIRWMIRHDMPSILEISKATPEPWTEGDIVATLRERNSIGMVAEMNGGIVGYMIYTLERNRLVLRTLAVHPAFRRRGIGRQLIHKLASKLSGLRRPEMLFDVRESRLDLQLFLRACGLRAIAIMERHYSDTGEDAYTMRLGCDAA